MSRVVHFEIHADDPQRAASFYQGVFGWQINKWNSPVEYWLITTGPESEPGINGAIVRRNLPIDSDMTPVIAYVCTISVSSLDECISTITAHGGEIVLPKMAVPTVGWLAYGKDSEGNIFGILQADASAA